MSLAETLTELACAADLCGAVCADESARAIFDEAAGSVDVEPYEAALQGFLRASGGDAGTWRVIEKPISSSRWRDVIDRQQGTILWARDKSPAEALRTDED